MWALKEQEPLPSCWSACTEWGCSGGRPGEGGKTPALRHRGKKLSCWSREQGAGSRQTCLLPHVSEDSGRRLPTHKSCPCGAVPEAERTCLVIGVPAWDMDKQRSGTTTRSGWCPTQRCCLHISVGTGNWSLWVMGRVEYAET